MQVDTINSVVREVLQDLQLPIHYYVRFLNFALRGLKELNFDYPLDIKIVELTVNSYNAVTLPTDYVDFAEVSVKYGDKLLPLAQDDRINAMNNYADDMVTKIPHEQPKTLSIDELLLGNGGGAYQNINSHGEHLGKRFGSASQQRLTFKCIPERNEIQLDVDVEVDELVLVYISDGVSLTAANTINPLATSTLKAWIHYQRKLFGNFSRIERAEAKREFSIYRKNLSSRMNSMTMEDIYRSFRRGLHQSLHN